MKRTNSVADALNSGEAELGLGDGLRTRIPLGRAYTIDQTAGRVVKVWDHLNNREQIIYGDSGLRDVSELLTVARSAGTLHLSRSTQVVTLTINGLKPSATGSDIIAIMPSGFRPARTVFFQAEGVSAMGQVTQYGNTQLYDWVKDIPIFGTVTFITADPWPPTLPGKAV